ncbi:MAG: ABC transporter family substrate-binding protein [Actinobacteria bacterium]|nr:ABC transporter family substrate-binding protein [Actinomycetota bacterium]
MKKTLKAVFAGLSALSLAITALVSVPAANAAGATSINAQPVSKLKQGGTLTLPILYPPIQYNISHPDGNDADVSTMMGMTLPSLIYFDSAGKLQIDKNYVSAFEQTKASPQTLRIVLNPKAIWSNGKKITLADFVGHWKAMNGKDEAYQVVSTQGYEDIKSVKAGANANEIIVTMSKGYPDWQSLFSGLLPASLTKDAATFNDAWRTKPGLGSGPFIFESANADQTTVVWKRNPKWWGAKPLLDKVIYRSIPPSAQYAALANNEIQYMDLATDANSLKLARANSKLQVHDVPGVGTWEHIDINSKNPILADANVRRAITVALNRQVIAEANTGLFVKNPVVKNNRTFYEGQACHVDASGKYGKKNTALADELLDKAIGIDLQLREVPRADYFSKYVDVEKLDFELVTFAWTGSSFPIGGSMNLYAKDSNQNYAKDSVSTELDAIIKKAASELDPVKRCALANQVEKALWNVGYNIPLYMWPGTSATVKSLANFGSFGPTSLDWTKVGFMK